jgi:hypothetical protein
MLNPFCQQCRRKKDAEELFFNFLSSFRCDASTKRGRRNNDAGTFLSLFIMTGHKFIMTGYMYCTYFLVKNIR